jgi:hypothetical protein
VTEASVSLLTQAASHPFRTNDVLLDVATAGASAHASRSGHDGTAFSSSFESQPRTVRSCRRARVAAYSFTFSDSVATAAFDLDPPVRHVIHTVVRSGKAANTAKLRSSPPAIDEASRSPMSSTSPVSPFRRSRPVYTASRPIRRRASRSRRSDRRRRGGNASAWSPSMRLPASFSRPHSMQAAGLALQPSRVAPPYAHFRRSSVAFCRGQCLSSAAATR